VSVHAEPRQIDLEEAIAVHSRLADLKQKLASRTDGAGNPLHGYKLNVAALRAEIAKLEAPDA